MQRFQHPELLNLLWLLIPLAGLAWWAFQWRKNTIKKYFSERLSSIIIPYSQTSIEVVKWVFSAAIIIVMAIGIANPQKGVKKEKVKGQGIDLMILLDVSNSMLARDIQPNRLERSKLFISKLLDNLHHDRVGLIIFAGNAFQQVPLTIDYSSLKMSLPIISPQDIPSQGTNIGEAVDMAETALGKANSQNKAIIILTDGENHDKSANDAIDKARKNGIKTFAIGVGTEAGATIPIGNNEEKKDEDGNTVVTKINMDMIEDLASIGNGKYYQLSQGNIVPAIVSELEKIDKKDFEDYDFSNYISYFHWFLLASLILLFIQFVIPNIPFREYVKRITMSAVLIAVFTLPINTYSQSKNTKKVDESASQTLIRKGNVAFGNKKYDKAALYYQKSLKENPKQSIANYNLGNSYYNMQQYDKAASQYEQVTKKSQNTATRAKAYHNLGNTKFKQNNLEDAIKAYENSLMLNPSDMDTKFNLALAKKKKEQQDKNSGGGGSQNQQKPQNQDQQNQDKKDGEGDKKDQQNQPQDGEGEEKQQEQPKPSNGKMTKEQAEKLLNALKNQEKNTNRRMNNMRQKPQQEDNEKDW